MSLKLSVGQYSDKGRKEINQDFHGAYFPEEPLLSSKGVSIALADGISSSAVSQIASESAVTGFFSDYYSTSETWTVKSSVQRVLAATNSWLHSQTHRSQYRYDKNKGYVCTFSAIVIKSSTAHIFHAGDARVYRLHNDELEKLTNDHRLWVSEDESYLSRGLGINAQLEMDYSSLPVVVGDVFLLATDGVYEYITNALMLKIIGDNSQNFSLAAKIIVDTAYQNGSADNLTVQLVRVEQLPSSSADEMVKKLTELPFPPMLEARENFDRYSIIRKLHGSSRSHIYLAVDEESGVQAVLKTPSVDLRDDPAYLERFHMEEWIARRINSAHVLKPCQQTRQKKYLYIANEFIEGQTLTQWMTDHPKPDIFVVRDIITQIAKGLRAFHRLEMLHQDLRPENIMIDSSGTVKIIDFGSTRVAGVSEIFSPIEQSHILGTAQYTAPEYYLGEYGSERSDLFSLGVIAYQMLSGRLPYGINVSKARTKSAQRRLVYTSVLDEDREIPAWIDFTLRKAVHINRYKRYAELSEFIYDLSHPNREFLNKARAPLLERNPTLFWQGVCCFLAFVILVLLYLQKY